MKHLNRNALLWAASVWTIALTDTFESMKPTRNLLLLPTDVDEDQLTVNNKETSIDHPSRNDIVHIIDHRIKNKRLGRSGNMVPINNTDDVAAVRRQLNMSSNPDSEELLIFHKKEILHQQLLDMASNIETGELSNCSPENETSHGKVEEGLSTFRVLFSN